MSGKILDGMQEKSMTQRTLGDIIENFVLLEDWEERYRYLIELGRDLPVMDESLKTERSLVPGCTSRVWLTTEEDSEGRRHFVADSDAHIVRGLIALLLAAYQDKTADEIATVDIEGVFKETGLDTHLSPNRRNGFFAMVEKIRRPV